MTSHNSNRGLSGSSISTGRLVRMALFSAILCIAAYISLPLPLPGAPHITLQNFIIILVALLFEPAESLLVIVVWMILGIAGLPVFIGGRMGIGYLIAPWGGYTLGFLPAVLFVSALRGKTYSRIRCTIAAVAGVLFIDLFGMCWLMRLNHLDLGTAFLTGFVVFLPLDILKALAAAQAAPIISRALHAGHYR